jgi:hypothetical protein
MFSNTLLADFIGGGGEDDEDNDEEKLEDEVSSQNETT